MFKKGFDVLFVVCLLDDIMDVMFVYSSLVPASKEMGECLQEIGIEVIDTKVKSILDVDHAEEVKKAKKGVVVLSPHKSEKNISSLTVHTPGNWGKAMFGGRARTLNTAMPLFMTNVLNEIKNMNPPTHFQICYEVDHHGPTINAPICFVEIGSSEKEWKNKAIANLMANAIVNALDKWEERIVACGFGGGHYAPLFTKLAFEGYAFGHMMAKYNANDLDKDMFRQAIEKNTEEIGVVIVDKKGLASKHKKLICEMCNEFGIEMEMR